MYYKVRVKFKNGSNTDSVFFRSDDVLMYVDVTIGDDYLYDQVFDWLEDTPKTDGDFFDKYPITIIVKQDD